MESQGPVLLARGNRPNPLVVGTAILLLIIFGMNLIFLLNLRESSLQTTESDLARYSLTLAEQADRSFKSLDLVLSSVGDYVGRKGAADADSYRRLASTHDTFLFLQEKIIGMPQVDAVTMIDTNGKLLNFSRYWPTPDVNVSDRDYFRALQADPNLETFISAPVQNRGDGTWVIYVARRLNDPNGNFMGLILGAMSMRYFENFFGVTSFGAGSSVALMRDDEMLLAHFPRTDHIGQVVRGTARRPLAAGGIIRELGAADRPDEIRSARMLSNYPLIIVASETVDSALTGWRRMAGLLVSMSIVCSIVLLVAAYVSARLWRQHERAAQAAQAASHAKSSFLAVMSHEIRTPMNAILGLTSAVLETRLDDEQRNLLVAAQNAGENLLEILNDILDFSKLEAGQVSLEAIVFSPASLAHNALSIFRPRAFAKGLEISLIEDPGLPGAVTGDAGRIRQILLNLVSNAVKFTETGEVVIAVRCLQADSTRPMIEWSVRDTGIGIDPDRIKDLFADFTQADSSIGRRFGGSGLGLAISKRLAQQMGGDIEAVSAPGQGSIFRVGLPLPVADQPVCIEQDDGRAFEDFAAKIAALGRPLRVLVVDDDPTNRLVAVHMLKQFDVRTTMACDGAEAVAAVSQFCFDVVLMDMRMPEMDGVQATRTIRARGGALARLPIIAFTANAFADDVQSCKAAGMDEFVAKPVRKRLLIQTMLRALQNSPADASASLPQIEAPRLVPTPRRTTDDSLIPAAPRVCTPAPTSADDTPVFDRAAYDVLISEMGEQPVGQMRDVFVTETKARMKRFCEVSLSADRLTIEREAHSLKSSAATFGLVRLAKLARALENDAATIGEDDYRALIDGIEAAFTGGLAELPMSAAV